MHNFKCFFSIYLQSQNKGKRNKNTLQLLHKSVPVHCMVIKRKKKGFLLPHFTTHFQKGFYSDSLSLAAI